MLETMVSSSSGLTFSRITRSISMTCCSVFSTRWPTGARTTMRNWLSSLTGMNSCPMYGINPSELVNTSRITPMSVFLCASVQVSACW
ncbi:MAG: hypothetical protein A3K11_07260 [Nitrospirae bacterium RIFCSPLOWO2_12_FULL_63_8]|nr:MAG: hypothetical protein A3K11_07260 [Nitrospirae bacterium RIFCSPLOWO2_12_FULL_63_8]